MTNSKTLKLIKLLTGILLLPCCVAITISFLHQLDIMGHGGGLLHDWRLPFFAMGFAMWLVAFYYIPKPTRVYVFGHELTHALWAKMMGAKVGSLRVGKNGGSVAVSKTNFLITLSPYFFPFYCVLFGVVFLAGDFFWDWYGYIRVLCFSLGLGWSFHLTFTITTLFTRQSDVMQNGRVFSGVVIYWMNFLVLGLILNLITTRGNVWSFLKLLWHDHVDVWTWLARAIGAIVS
ncbi:MAG: hypothetical protein EXS18_08005 [Verrucomicrobiae bacterium]|nr:hypothetical protein [Verrucomicrobiae bacterium]